MPAPVEHGLNAYFGAQFTASNVMALPQSLGHRLTSQVSEIMDGGNNWVARANSNFRESMDFKYFSFDVNSPAGNGTIAYPTQGTMFSITTGNAAPGLSVTGSNWVSDNIDVDYDHAGFAEITIHASRASAITS